MRAEPPVDIAVFARAPVAGQVKTRLIPLLGADGAAALQRRLIERTLATARAVDGARVTLWVAGEPAHPFVEQMAARFGVAPTSANGCTGHSRLPPRRWC